MKNIFFTPGPSQLYPTVEKYLQKAVEQQIGSISHRGKKFEEVFSSATEGIKSLLCIPKDYAVVFVSSGTEAMERVIENTVETKSFHFVNGSFSKRFYDIAQELGKHAGKTEVDFGQGFHEIPEFSQQTELICFTQNETSSGVAIDPMFIYKVCAQYPKALVAVDIVSSAPYVDLDYRQLDCVFFSVQKGFGLPAGLGIMILSPKAIEKSLFLQKRGVSIGTYHNFLALLTWATKYQTPETPNVLGIYLLDKIIGDFLEKGIETIRKETDAKAKMIYGFLEDHTRYTPFVEKKDRSQTVIVAEIGNAVDVLERLSKQGIVVGSGYGQFKESQIRIANFPAVSRGNIEDLLKVL